METSESLIWPFQVGRAAGMGGPEDAVTEQSAQRLDRSQRSVQPANHCAGSSLGAGRLLPAALRHLHDVGAGYREFAAQSHRQPADIGSPAELVGDVALDH